MLRSILTGLTVSVFASSLVLAQEGKSCCAGATAAKAVATDGKSCSGEKSACSAALAKAGANTPKMTYKVGEKSTCCPDEAQKLAGGDAKLVKFVVADKEYSDKSEALTAYGKLLDEHLGQITTVKYAVGKECMSCPVSAGELAKKEGKKVEYRLASFNFSDKEAADKAAKSARDAADKVSMKIMVGDQTYSCPTMAAAAAKTCGRTVEYVIGETRTPCNTTAQVELAKARIEAALAAIATVDGATLASAG